MIKINNMNRRHFIQASMGVAAASLMSMQNVAAQTVSGLFDDIPLDDIVMGDVNAPVTLVEYASMTCPHCKNFHEKILPSIKEKYVDTGKLKYILRPFPFDGDRRGEAAFMLAICAPNNNYYAMVDALFETQATWANPQINPVPELLRLSKLSGMSEADFKACLSKQDVLDKMIAGRNKAVKDFEVRSTPTVFLNDKKFSGDSSPEGYSKAIEALL